MPKWNKEEKKFLYPNGVEETFEGPEWSIGSGSKKQMAYNPLIESLVEELATPGITGPIEYESLAHNEFDHRAVEISRETSQYLGSTKAIDESRIIERTFQSVSEIYMNNFDGAVITHINVRGFTWGYVIKGPAHPRSETDRIPVIIITLHDARALKNAAFLWELGNKKTYIHMEDERIAVIHQTSVWIAKLKYLSYSSRCQVQMANETLAILQTMCPREGSNIPDWSIRTDEVMDLILKTQSETLLCAAMNDSELEGTLDNIRRLIIQTNKICYKGEATFILMKDGETAESKVEECLIGNPLAFYWAKKYNEWLVQDHTKIVYNLGKEMEKYREAPRRGTKRN